MLFRAYAASLGISLEFQDFEAELAALPGKYASPSGMLLLAEAEDGAALGCVGLRPLDSRRCEMKRLYLTPAARGRGLGPALVEAVIEAAQRIGYREMLLDTLPTMAAAQALYRRFGFTPVAPYYDSPIPGTVFLRRVLDPAPPVTKE